MAANESSLLVDSSASYRAAVCLGVVLVSALGDLVAVTTLGFFITVNSTNVTTMAFTAASLGLSVQMQNDMSVLVREVGIFAASSTVTTLGSE